MIRVAQAEDAAAVVEIYAPNILHKVTSFEATVPTVAEMEQRITGTLPTHPWLVYAPDGAVRGYAYAGPHRARAAYQWSTDVSVYIADAAQRQGIGRALYASLLGLLRLQGYFNAYAGVTLPNPGSVGLHEAMGFEPLGVYRGVGYKFGAWHDVGWWSLALQPKTGEPAPPIPFALAPTLAGYAEALDAGTRHLRPGRS